MTFNITRNSMFTCHNSLENYYCKDCGFGTPLRIKLNYHICTSYKICQDYGVIPPIRKYRCGKCKFTSHSLLVYSHHKRNCTLVVSHKCRHCPFKTSYKRILKEHSSKWHNTNKWFKCDQCDFKVEKKLDLKIHVTTKHIHTCTFLCSCENKYAETKDYPKHLQIYSCTKCIYSTTNNYDLELHSNKIHGRIGSVSIAAYPTTSKVYQIFSTKKVSTPSDSTSSKATKVFECNKCIYKTSEEKQLTSHMISIHNTCFCGYESREMDDLQEHYEIKHPEQVHRCTQCSYSTLDEDYLKRHHCKKYSRVTEIVPFMYKCSYCSFQSEYKIALQSHVYKEHRNTQHKVVKTFQCHKCCYRAATAGYLAKHVKLMHKQFTYRVD